MAMRLVSTDVCVQGFERLRSQSEFILLATLQPSTTARDIESELLADIQSCERYMDFDYEEANRVVKEFMAGTIRPAFRAKRWNPFNVERAGEHDESCHLYLYIHDNTLDLED